MAKFFNVKRPSGKLFACVNSREHAEREISWMQSSGSTDKFSIEPVDLDMSNRWGYGAPVRYVAPWCDAKVEEFRSRYAAGETIRALADYFDTNECRVSIMARRLGFGYRIDDPANFEKHRGRWTEREYQLVNLLYDEGVDLDRIPDHHPRTKSAVTAALRATARTYSTRSRHFGRFIASYNRRGKKKAPALLGEAGEPSSTGAEMRKES